ncbi:MAG: ABC transporter ATP-binding protein [Deltaproteobacteria bacterium]|jgi:iron complex transport system ATP-binding protein|nr:ABC transporter ATP-binding protein [Deltaproteobacteria bacterium]
MLAVENLSFGYTALRKILKGITFNIRQGEVLALLGPNGTGKTTLMRCLLGLLKPDGGRTDLFGRDILKLSAKERSRMIAYAPQSSSMTFPYDVLEVVMMGRLPHLGFGSSPSRKDRFEAEKALEIMRIGHLASNLFQSLSGGEKQLVVIARALAQKARLMVLDEPMANLDFYNQARSLKILRSLARQGHTVLWTTHSPDQALLVADRLVMIKDGQVYADGRPEDVITGESLSELYGLNAVVTETSVISAGKPVKICVPIID